MYIEAGRILAKVEGGEKGLHQKRHKVKNTTHRAYHFHGREILPRENHLNRCVRKRAVAYHPGRSCRHRHMSIHTYHHTQ